MSKVDKRKKLASKRLEQIGTEKIRAVLLQYHGMNAKTEKDARSKFIRAQADNEGLGYQAYKQVLTAYRQQYGKIRVCANCQDEITQDNECTNNSYCKSCWAEMSRQRRQDRKGEILAEAQKTGAVDTKVCEGCKRNVSLLKYAYNNAPKCNSCSIKDFRAKKPMSQHEINRSKAASIMAPRVAKTKSGAMIARNWRGAILEYEDIFKIHIDCYCCGKKLELWHIIHVDHINPLEIGGLHNRYNIAPVHEECNYYMSSFDVLGGELGEDIQARAENAVLANRKYYKQKDKC